MSKKTDPKVAAINHAIEAVLHQFKGCRAVCATMGSPLRSITFRVRDDGTTNTRITYRRKKTTKK
jgi:hypothetical protein